MDRDNDRDRVNTFRFPRGGGGRERDGGERGRQTERQRVPGTETELTKHISSFERGEGWGGEGVEGGRQTDRARDRAHQTHLVL